MRRIVIAAFVLLAFTPCIGAQSALWPHGAMDITVMTVTRMAEAAA